MQAGLLALALAAGTTLIVGWPGIILLTRLRAGQNVRSDGPRSHLAKAGTPTMGGLLFLIGTSVATLLLAPPTPEIWILLLATWGFALIGFADDFLKVVLRRPLGLLARQKLGGQIILGLAVGASVVFLAGRGTDLTVPVLGWQWHLGWLYIPFACLLMVAAGNAVNLTDGLDGLAAGVTFWVALAYFLIGLFLDKIDLVIFTLALAGGCAGFLVYNFHPARIFMGDTGSLALGGAIGALALLTRTEMVLPLLGGIYVLETLSVIIQVVFFRLTGRRFFRMSPLHHHFELLGWPETRVVFFFWFLAIIFAVLGLSLI
ncbi:MAG: phospho-N-acetylmuramoyl-pentapeptide-transferase [Clostridia bacterium]|nr:phospho-N-acetylmuramoyl-pentapeptide-transferase [Clostridia bacterium]